MFRGILVLERIEEVSVRDAYGKSTVEHICMNISQHKPFLYMLKVLSKNYKKKIKIMLFSEKWI